MLLTAQVMLQEAGPGDEGRCLTRGNQAPTHLVWIIIRILGVSSPEIVLQEVITTAVKFQAVVYQGAF